MLQKNLYNIYCPFLLVGRYYVIFEGSNIVRFSTNLCGDLDFFLTKMIKSTEPHKYKFKNNDSITDLMQVSVWFIYVFIYNIGR